MQAGTDPLNPLLATLRERIAAHGPMRFAEFMRAALYDREHGYYTSGRTVWGADGDYVTAPRVHPAFGAAVARLAAEVDAALGQPERFDLVEVGGGEGHLLGTALGAIRGRHRGLWQRTRAGIVERGAPARARALAATAPPPGGAWQGAEVGDAGATVCGLVFCNELLDAFPVERVRRRGSTLEQSRIELDGDRLVERFAAPVDDAVREYLEAAGVDLVDGQVAEVCLEVGPWLAAIDAVLEAGALLVVDYGHETSTLYGPERPRGTLVTMRWFRLGDDPLEHPGRQDLTSHVDLGNLRRLGQKRGLSVQGPCSLRVFLLGLGAAEEPPQDARERLALRHLLLSEIGDAHKAMLLSRALPQGGLRFGRARLEQPPTDAAG